MAPKSHVRRLAGNHAAQGPAAFRSVPNRPCTPGPEVRYWGREVGGGRASRQPGQVRKEAAVTSFRTGRVPASHPSSPAGVSHAAVPHDRMTPNEHMTDLPASATPYRV